MPGVTRLPSSGPGSYPWCPRRWRGWGAKDPIGVMETKSMSDNQNGIPYRRLGRTGEMVSLIGVGGYHLGRQADEREAIRIVRTAVDSGINFLDNCWDYNGGASELRMGKALRDGYRQKAFLMTKIDGRSDESAARKIEESLRRLQTDWIDLMQFHEVIRMTDPERVFGTDGALSAGGSCRPPSEAAVEALLGRTAHAASDGKYELYKTTHHFDGTYQNPQWLG